MTDKKFKIVVLTHGGAERFLGLLSSTQNIEIAGVFVETATERKRSLGQKIKRSVRYDGYLATFKKFTAKLFGGRSDGEDELRSIQKNQDDLVKCAKDLNIPIYSVENYHLPATLKALRESGADLGVLYGTNIVDETVFSVPRLGSINIHQGLAPMYRGGPTGFWELFNGEKEVGITVHFVAAKVDAGDIILQKTVPLEYDHSRYGLNYEEFLHDFRASLKEPSAQLLVEAICQIAAGKERRTKQDTTIGKRYRLPIKSEKDELLRLLLERQRG
jgi:folate-dependent phosphoribosylglycinamide formyltransferase PurN